MKSSCNPHRPEVNNEMVLESPLLAELPWLVHGFTTRQGGASNFASAASTSGCNFRNDLNLGRVTWDNAENVCENRRRLLVRLHAEQMELVTLRQFHSDLIRVVDSSIPKAGDGLITAFPGFLLSILVADCLPILLVDAKLRVAAALHCGWRGTARRLAEKGVGLLRLIFGSQPRDLRAAIGPGIRVCCYNVGKDVEEEMEGQFLYARKLFIRRNEPHTSSEAKHTRLFTTYKTIEQSSSNPQLYLDLVLANVCQLRDAGLTRDHIYAEFPCTSCHPELFFSHRRDAGRTGRMMGVIGIREK